MQWHDKVSCSLDYRVCDSDYSGNNITVISTPADKEESMYNVNKARYVFHTGIARRCVWKQNIIAR